MLDQSDYLMLFLFALLLFLFAVIQLICLLCKRVNRNLTIQSCYYQSNEGYVSCFVDNIQKRFLCDVRCRNENDALIDKREYNKIIINFDKPLGEKMEFCHGTSGCAYTNDDFINITFDCTLDIIDEERHVIYYNYYFVQQSKKNHKSSINDVVLEGEKNIWKSQKEEWEITKEFSLVRQLLINDSPIVLVTGGAGTGKTTLIRWLQEPGVLPKNVAVSAFTGVAALVCEGKTIHSLFMLPLGVILPYVKLDDLSRERYMVLKHLDLLIIDEISMVRADIMDAIDRRLQEVKQNQKPFGGVQILMVGDPCQLPPVTYKKDKKFFTEESNNIDAQRWEGSRFFHANVFKGRKIKHVLLTKPFRQIKASEDYLNHLNKMRKLSVRREGINKVISYFNDHCYKKGSLLQKKAISITYTNDEADSINHVRLDKINKPEVCFEAEAHGCYANLKGDTKNDITKVPAPFDLRLKEEAQVMILINDPDQRYVNGTIGTISKIEGENVTVILPDDSKEVFSVHTWESYDYIYNDETKQYEKIIDGTYTQIPLVLAWAFTAHKSQGKTLERVNFIASGRSFCSGQTYVALSRTRRIEDVRLKVRLNPGHFLIDDTLANLKEYLETVNGSFDL